MEELTPDPFCTMRKPFLAIFLFLVTFHSLEELVSCIKEEKAAYYASTSLRRMGVLLEQPYNPKAPLTCDKFPKVCGATGSSGPDCCAKHCVNLLSDGLNCGRCGKTCRYGEKCCDGRCVDVMHDGNNCGACRMCCARGSFCRYGMCSYAN